MKALDTHNPRLTIAVAASAAGEAFALDVLIDTGFDGFLAMPLDLVMLIGLRTGGHMRYSLANSAVASGTSAKAHVTMAGMSRCGNALIQIAPGSDIIAGLTFLREFGFGITLVPSAATVDDAVVGTA